MALAKCGIILGIMAFEFFQIKALLRCNEDSDCDGSVCSKIPKWDGSYCRGTQRCDKSSDCPNGHCLHCLQEGTTYCLVDCRRPPAPYDGIVIYPEAVYVDIYAGDTAIQQCNHSSDTAIITCRADGLWTDSITCTVIECGSPPIPDNGDVRAYDSRNTFGSKAEQFCNKGYSPSESHIIECLASGSWTTSVVCTNNNECSSNPCRHGGTCTDSVNRYSCKCVAGYAGANCQTDINECSPNPCRNDGTCRDGVNSYSCECVAGITGTNCQTDINECSSNPCRHGGTCTDRVNIYSCQCVGGYTGANCQTDINECASNPCQHGGSCTDNVNSYSCQCIVGITGNNCRTGTTTLQLTSLARTKISFTTMLLRTTSDLTNTVMQHNENTTALSVSPYSKMKPVETSRTMTALQMTSTESVHTLTTRTSNIITKKTPKVTLTTHIKSPKFTEGSRLLSTPEVFKYLTTLQTTTKEELEKTKLYATSSMVAPPKILEYKNTIPYELVTTPVLLSEISDNTTGLVTHTENLVTTTEIKASINLYGNQNATKTMRNFIENEVYPTLFDDPISIAILSTMLGVSVIGGTGALSYMILVRAGKIGSCFPRLKRAIYPERKRKDPNSTDGITEDVNW